MIITHAFTLCPLYVEAILRYGKDVENRSWKLPEEYIGQPLALHAGNRNPERPEINIFAKPMLDFIDRIVPDELPRGGIVGWIRFDRPVKLFPSPWAVGELWHWPILEAHRFPESIPCGGKLMVWPLPESIHGGKIEVQEVCNG